ncbi:MAG: hypothetical protein AAB691_01990 [Patescibacteria group bacterium]
MIKNPLLSALAASVYIILVVTMVSFLFGEKDPDSPFTPVAMLSLFTLSAAVMGYLFILQPAELYLSGKKKEGVTLFLQTVASFAVITIVFFVALSLGIL